MDYRAVSLRWQIVPLRGTKAKKEYHGPAPRWPRLVEFFEETAQDTLLFHFLRVIVNQILQGRGFVLMLVDKKLNENMAGMAPSACLANLCNGIDII